MLYFVSVHAPRLPSVEPEISSVDACPLTYEKALEICRVKAWHVSRPEIAQDLEPAPASPDQVEEAAAVVFRELQARLPQEGETFINAQERRWWFVHRAQARQALALRSRALMLEIERQACGGPPLTVCVGVLGRPAEEVEPSADVRSARRRGLPDELKDRLDWIGYPGGDGCGRVIRESTRRPKRYCDSCRRTATARRRRERARLAALCEGVLPYGRHDEDGRTVFEGLCACGSEFSATDLRQRRCESCRAHHKARSS